MIPVLLAMLAIVLLAVLVVVYVAFPHRGREVPHAAWLGRAMSSGVTRLPTLPPQLSEPSQPAGGVPSPRDVVSGAAGTDRDGSSVRV